MAKNRKFVLSKKFEGDPKQTDFSLVDEPIPQVKDKEVHFEAIAISVDPYMRAIAHFAEPGITMFGEVVSKVVESRHPDYKVGDLVVGYFGWQTHYVGVPEEVDSPFGGKRKPYVLPDLHGLPPSLALGMLGMPGNSAYFGLTELCDPKPGKTLVISGAAGAVGSHVGQIGKILGCKVIGFAGSDDKVAYLQKELKFDFAFNYKKINITEALKIAAPEGVDYYFDNVGGTMSSQVLDLEWIRQGKLIYKEHATKGFEKTAQAFIGMMKGDNTGKAVVLV
ncbi:prostaglandin reductase 1 [Halyomorpha halys]|uniref:prostaglandin reductase 1 n=1 Tax=Halyomorpha halys TaxID=286706 RepID=UPI0006D4DF23